MKIYNSKPAVKLMENFQFSIASCIATPGPITVTPTTVLSTTITDYHPLLGNSAIGCPDDASTIWYDIGTSDTLSQFNFKAFKFITSYDYQFRITFSVMNSVYSREPFWQEVPKVTSRLRWLISKMISHLRWLISETLRIVPVGPFFIHPDNKRSASD